MKQSRAKESKHGRWTQHDREKWKAISLTEIAVCLCTFVYLDIWNAQLLTKAVKIILNNSFGINFMLLQWSN